MNWETLHFDKKTIKSTEYTKIAVENMNSVIEAENFDDMDAENIFSYLAKTMMIFSFSDYLKRYLYEYAEIKEPFHEIEDRIYMEIIKIAFEENQAPHAFEESSVKWTQRVKRFLSSSSVHRDTAFLLGFGLDMSDADVSDFLTKVLLEEDFNMYDPKEVIFCYCFHNHLRYSTAAKFMDYYNAMTETVTEADGPSAECLSKKVISHPRREITNEALLKDYLYHLKYHVNLKEQKDLIYKEFMKLYDRAKVSVFHIMETYDSNCIPLKKINPANFEKVLCCGIPSNGKGLMEPMSRSRLSAQFKNKRMNRQRIGAILARKADIERYDLLTLLFLVYSIDVEPEWPVERYLQYIKESNDILGRCNMMEIYPVNPYESFILMCLISESPLSVYNEVFELSYMDEEDSL